MSIAWRTCRPQCKTKSGVCHLQWPNIWTSRQFFSDVMHLQTTYCTVHQVATCNVTVATTRVGMLENLTALVWCTFSCNPVPQAVSAFTSYTKTEKTAIASRTAMPPKWWRQPGKIYLSQVSLQKCCFTVCWPCLEGTEELHVHFLLSQQLFHRLLRTTL